MSEKNTDTAQSEFTLLMKPLDLGFTRLPVEVDIKPGTEKVVAAIRPEAIRISLEQAEGFIEATLDNSQPTGSQTILFLHVGNRKLTSIVAGFSPLEPGRRLWFKVDLGDINFFDPDSRRLIESK